ncbi:MAG TPA: hypothetical protein VHN81_09975 [Edaphobacter sp.]|nr:hypothetical protein [Edaphobacter sp.]
MLRSVFLAVSLTLVPFAAAGQSTKDPNLAGCTAKDGQTLCNLYWLRKTVDTAHTAKAEYGERDRATGAQLKDLAKSLGKSLANPDQPADLTFAIAPAPISGVDVGPADEEILELKVYSGEDAQRKLIWVETYRGQKDRPWPANVHAAIEQFRKKLAQS